MRFYNILALFLILPKIGLAIPIEQKVCSAKEDGKLKIERCLRETEENHCEDFPTDQRKNCFDPNDSRQIDFAGACASGTWKGVKETVVGAYDFGKKIITNGAARISDDSVYMKEVRKNADKTCQESRKVKEAKELANRVASNVGRDHPQYMNHLNLANQAYTDCFRAEENKGKNLGVGLSLPEASEIKGMLYCLKAESQVEIFCSVVVPMLATGPISAGVKTAVKQYAKAKSLKSAAQVAGVSEEYIQKLSEGKLTPAELASLKHQQDLLALVSNPEANKILAKAGVDLKAIVQGMMDSDLGKLKQFQKLLLESSTKSDELLKVLNGTDQSSKAGKAFSDLMKESGLEGKTFFNKDLSPDAIRKVISDNPSMINFLHEAPGIAVAIEDLNKGVITAAEFKKRLGANLFHNGPQAGFWDQITNKFVSDNLKTDHDKIFFKGTVFEGETVEGVVRAKYRDSITKEGKFHQAVDRLSQGTGDGQIKIFNEIGGSKLAENVSVKIGEMPNPFGKSGTVNGLNIWRDLIEGNPLAKPPVKSNAALTLDQFAEMERLGKTTKVFANEVERGQYMALRKSMEDRLKAFNDFTKPPQIEFVKDASGNVEKIILKGPPETGSKYIGTIDKNTPTIEAINKMKTLYAKEELLNGHPIKDLMKPRKLTPAEILQINPPLAIGSAVMHYYCSEQEYRSQVESENPIQEDPSKPAKYRIKFKRQSIDPSKTAN